MKMKIIILLVVSLFLFTSCVNNKETEITYKEINSFDINEMSESMQNFYNTESETHVIGEHFQVKIISLSKVVFNKPDYDTSYKLYRYQILVAPVLDEKILLKNIIFDSDEKLNSYYENVPKGRNSIDVYQLNMDESYFKEQIGLSNLLAYRLDFMFSNSGDDYQKETNISDETFDDYIQTLNLKICYNDTEEIITIRNQNEMLCIENVDQIPNDRKDLKILFEEGGTYSVFGPYQDELLFK